jgi:hypothetical protein
VSGVWQTDGWLIMGYDDRDYDDERSDRDYNARFDIQVKDRQEWEKYCRFPFYIVPWWDKGKLQAEVLGVKGEEEW